VGAQGYRHLRVAEVIAETADSCSFVLDTPPELGVEFHYRPGQFLTLRIPCGEHWLPRCYSLSSTPAENEPLRVTVKRVEHGYGSNWLLDHLRAGDQIEVLPPAGVFTPRHLDSDFLLFAGGSGITPVLSILRSALHQGQGRIRLVYANRDQDSVIFRDTLRQLSARHPQRLQVIHWLDSVQGYPSTEQLAGFADGFEHAQAFICGPGPFMDSSALAVQQAGLPKKAVHIERFISLPAEHEHAAADISAPVDAQSARLTVELDGHTRQLTCAPGERLLTAMRREGIEAPHSCLVGSCASCMCTLVEGRVELIANQALDQQELEEGWILACQAVAVSDHVHVRFPD